MITSIKIENFKSIQSLDLELGRLNIFIGTNGSGKSNILEAIGMGSAAMDGKLDDEFLTTRGIRVTEPNLLKSAFRKNDQNLPVKIFWGNNIVTYGLEIDERPDKFSNWKAKGEFLHEFELDKILEHESKDIIKEYTDKFESPEEKELFHTTVNKRLKAFSEDTIKSFTELSSRPEFLKIITAQGIFKKAGMSDFYDFLIYAPENHFLRRFEEEAAIKPLGIKGEGLFKLITIISQEYPDQFNEIKKHLKLIDWFEDFEIPNDLRFTERRIKIKDKYLDDSFQYFDQRSANEGFLYLLFYLTLFVSDLTPHFFAIDNIDNSLNPKLGSA